MDPESVDPVSGETGGDPAAEPGGDTGAAYLAELPAGRYAVHVHEGAYSADDETWAGRDLAQRPRMSAPPTSTERA